jgi:hypothetical protein
MRYRLSGKLVSKSRNDLVILPLALPFRCIWGVLGRYRCESPPLHITHVSQLQQSYVSGVFIRGAGLQIFEMVKSSKDSMDCLSN